MKSKFSETLQTRELIAETEALLSAHERSLYLSYHLCASDLAILTRLQKKGSKPVNQLAAKVGLTSGSMTTAVQRLQKREMITTNRDEKDGRKVWVEITKKGKQTVRDLTSEREKQFGPIFSSFSDREEKVLVALLKKIRKATRPNN